MRPTSSSPRLCRLVALASACVLGVANAVAGWAGIDDRAGFFSEAAKASAQRQIADLQRQQKKDFALETFATIPAEAGPAPAATDKAALGRFMEQWAEKQAREKRVNGVYALLVKNPPHLQVVVGNETQKRAFTLIDRDELVSRMLGKLRAKDFDGALTTGVNFVASTMRTHAGAVTTSAAATATKPWAVERPALPVKEPGAGSGLLTLVVIGLGVWLVIALIRMMTRGNSPAAPGLGGGGGGFLSSLMGGLFGAAAGMWMYNHFFGGGGTSAYGGEPNGDQSGGFTGEDTNYSGSGGSFGDDSGGGGFGGGDSGGGFGGGDFGGGGDSGGGGSF